MCRQWHRLYEFAFVVLDRQIWISDFILVRTPADMNFESYSKRKNLYIVPFAWLICWFVSYDVFLKLSWFEASEIRRLLYSRKVKIVMCNLDYRSVHLFNFCTNPLLDIFKMQSWREATLNQRTLLPWTTKGVIAWWKSLVHVIFQTLTTCGSASLYQTLWRAGITSWIMERSLRTLSESRHPPSAHFTHSPPPVSLSLF